MDFIRQLVAFSIMTQEEGGVLGKSPEEFQDLWVHCANATDETTLVAPLSEDGRAEYQKWLDTWIYKVPRGPEEREPVEEMEQRENIEGEIVTEAPLEPVEEYKPGKYELGSPAEPDEETHSVEPKPKKRRAKRVKSNKS